MSMLRSLLAFIALPCVMAGAVPWIIVRSTGDSAEYVIPGFTVLAVGLLLLLLCVREFHTTGKGTLAPWDPPKHLVVTGPYAITRNPMYIAVLAILSGWSLLFNSVELVVYLVVLATAFHLRVILYEEPRAQKQFGGAWVVYKSTVRRWIPDRTRSTIQHDKIVDI
jgi:protein-S-isoprenylcysteine O-methyltransferase Ste14